MVDDALTLDLHLLIRLRLIRPGKCSHNTFTWTSKMTNSPEPATIIATIEHEASLLDPGAASVRLDQTLGGVPQDYRVRLTTTPCHYGGRRW